MTRRETPMSTGTLCPCHQAHHMRISKARLSVGKRAYSRSPNKKWLLSRRVLGLDWRGRVGQRGNLG